MTVVLTVSVILFGILAYLRLPVNDLAHEADLAIAQRLMGHESPSTTVIYDRRGALAEDKAVEDL